MVSFTKAKEHMHKHWQKHTFKRILQKLAEHKSPHEVALGAGIGLFFSIIPLPFIGMLIALLIAWKRRLNLVATYLGTAIVNPFTVYFFYYLNYKVGAFFLGESIKITFGNINELLNPHIIWDILGQLFLGGVILAFVMSIILYSLVYVGIIRYKELKHKALERKLLKAELKKQKK